MFCLLVAEGRKEGANGGWRRRDRERKRKSVGGSEWKGRKYRAGIKGEKGGWRVWVEVKGKPKGKLRMRNRGRERRPKKRSMGVMGRKTKGRICEGEIEGQRRG